MELTVDRDKALAAMGRVAGVVTRSSEVPIRENVLIVAAEARVTIQACNLDIEISSAAAADVSTPGEITVPAQRLHDMLKSLPPGGQLHAELTSAPQRLTVKCGRSRFQLPTLPATDFPRFDTTKAEHSASMPAKTVGRLIDQVAFAASREETRIYLCGVSFHPTADGRFRAVATDGNWLGYQSEDLPGGWESAAPLTVPNKAVGEIRRLVDGVSGDVAIWTNGRLLGVETSNAKLITKLMDQSFPDYERLIPAAYDGRLLLDVVELGAALKRCAVMAHDKGQVVKLKLEGDVLTLRARDGLGGEVEEAVEIDYAGPATELNFNSKFLLEVVGRMTGEHLLVEFSGPTEIVKFSDPLTQSLMFISKPLIT